MYIYACIFTKIYFLEKKKQIQNLYYYESILLEEPNINFSLLSFLDNQLNIFKEASWVNARKSPFKKLKSGIFEARYNGIYLVYGQVLCTFHLLVQLYTASTIQYLWTWITIKVLYWSACVSCCLFSSV